MTDSVSEQERVLNFWFGTLDEAGCADEEHSRRWWKKDPNFDQAVREQFGSLQQAVASGAPVISTESPRGRLACIIVLDQFSRNLFRGTSRAFAGDGRALELATDAVARGLDRTLAHDERVFTYMPYMHSEDLRVQERSVELFRALRDSLSGAMRDRANEQVDFAERHRDIVRRFGRFPHRNASLDRTSTAEEIQFLREPNSSF